MMLRYSLGRMTGEGSTPRTDRGVAARCGLGTWIRIRHRGKRCTHAAFVALLPAVLTLACGVWGCSSLKTIGMRKQTVTMEVTAYCACKQCTEWKRKWGCCLLSRVYATGPQKGERKVVGITADGSKARKGTLAADTTRYPFGTRMYVPGYGWGVVQDRGRAIKGDRLDVFFGSHKKALEWGRQRLEVDVYFPR